MCYHMATIKLPLCTIQLQSFLYWLWQAIYPNKSRHNPTKWQWHQVNGTNANDQVTTKSQQPNIQLPPKLDTRRCHWSRTKSCNDMHKDSMLLLGTKYHLLYNKNEKATSTRGGKQTHPPRDCHNKQQWQNSKNNKNKKKEAATKNTLMFNDVKTQASNIPGWNWCNWETVPIQKKNQKC